MNCRDILLGMWYEFCRYMKTVSREKNCWTGNIVSEDETRKANKLWAESWVK